MIINLDIYHNTWPTLQSSIPLLNLLDIQLFKELQLNKAEKLDLSLSSSSRGFQTLIIHCLAPNNFKLIYNISQIF